MCSYLIDFIDLKEFIIIEFYYAYQETVGFYYRTIMLVASHTISGGLI
ncbi:hypothetical protein THOE12_20581 [Vibrio rotiferianus]|nr:hypothetical protein THOE12_20581 [Vibrio rotiferianus]